MAHWKRRRSKRQIRCSMCTPHRWLGNAKARFKAKYMTEQQHIRAENKHTVLMSADYFDAITKGRVSRSVADLDDATMNAIAKAEVPAEYGYLDELMKAK